MKTLSKFVLPKKFILNEIYSLKSKTNMIITRVLQLHKSVYIQRKLDTNFTSKHIGYYRNRVPELLKSLKTGNVQSSRNPFTF